MPKKIELPVSICKFGYPASQLVDILPAKMMVKFLIWMRGTDFFVL